MERIQINQILQDLSDQVYNKIISSEERDTFREQTINKIKEILKISQINRDPLEVYNFFSDILTEYLFNPERDSSVGLPDESILQPILSSDSEEIKNLKRRINEELTNFMDNVYDLPDISRGEAISLRNRTLINLMEINGIQEEFFKLYIYADSELWRILNIHNYNFQPNYSFEILNDDSESLKSIKERMNLDLEILQKGLLEYESDPINKLNTVCLVYIYDKLLEKYEERDMGNATELFNDFKIFLQKCIWKNELPSNFNNLYDLIQLFNNLSSVGRGSEFTNSIILESLELFTEEHLQFMNELGIDYSDIARLGLVVTNPLFGEIEEVPSEPVTSREQDLYEEDQVSEYELEAKSVSSSDSVPFRNQLCPESFITLDKYELEEYNQMLSFYLTKDDLQSYYRLPSCLTKRELLDMVISDVERYVANPRDIPNNIPNTIMCISTPPEAPQRPNDFLTGLSSKPTPKIFVKIPYQYNDSMSFYVTLGSFLRAVTLPPQEWFALPLFGGQRKRLGNLAGFYGQSMNHGQIPGFRLYKLYTRSEINNLELRVTENLTDYPLIFYQNFRNISFETQQKDLSLIEMVYHTIDFFLRFDSRSFTFSE